jgi:hypothetical protein
MLFLGSDTFYKEFIPNSDFHIYYIFGEIYAYFKLHFILKKLGATNLLFCFVFELASILIYRVIDVHKKRVINRH